MKKCLFLLYVLYHQGDLMCFKAKKSYKAVIIHFKLSDT